MDIDNLGAIAQDCWPSGPSQFLDTLAMRAKVEVFRLASLLTDPVCKVHELFRRYCLVDRVTPQASLVERVCNKVAICAAATAYAFIAAFTTIPAVAIRAIASRLQKDPYIYLGDQSVAKNLPLDRQFTMLSWNVCLVKGGYTISDGGVSPAHTRIAAIAKKIIDTNADVTCLYEAYDVKDCMYLREQLKSQGYGHFYFNMGSKGVGPSSGIFVASKYSIANPEFTLFPKDTLVGRTKTAGKGVFSFDLESHGNSFARIHATHLQHSERSAFPTPEELNARKMEMDIIVDKVNHTQGKCSIVTGDLNLDDSEYYASDWAHRFSRGNCHFTEKTWGGDEFCALMTNKPISKPLNLDHTIVAIDPQSPSRYSLDTRLIGTGYDPAVYKEGALALSDHDGLLSVVGV
ncbi:MAG: endonuclease/exonuclease/phosphatase family protein [Chlamydiota bacterium]